MRSPNPGELSYGTGGIGSLAHILMESFKRPLGLDIFTCLSKDRAHRLLPSWAGHVDMLMTAFAAVGPHVTAGNVKVLAVSSATRSPASAGCAVDLRITFRAMTSLRKSACFAPAGTPRTSSNKLAAEVAKAVTTPGHHVSDFSTIGALPMSTTPEAYAENIKRQLPRFERR